MEEALRDRLSFLRFSGLSFHSPTPDASTICRFRQALARRDLYHRLLDGINRQLTGYRQIIKTGVAVDVCVVASSRRPRKVIEVETGEEERTAMAEDSGVKVSYSADAEASWTVKGKQPPYGYKVRMATEVMDGFILGGRVTPANRADTSEFQRVVDELKLKPNQLVLVSCPRNNLQ
jgi:IS5 family transposase